MNLSRWGWLTLTALLVACLVRRDVYEQRLDEL